MRRHTATLLLASLIAATALSLNACGNHRTASVTSPTLARDAAEGSPANHARVRICHSDEDGVSHVIIVDEHAVPAHLAHGDALLVDADGDGYVAGDNDCVPGGDCDDNDPSVHPGAQELCDGKDNDCNGLVDEGMEALGTQQFDILRDPTRLSESAMGNMVADALRANYPEAEVAIMNSGGLRADLRMVPPAAGENPGEILCRELFAILPFGNKAVLLTLTGAQLEQALLNGLSPRCNPAIPTGRFPQVSGLKVEYGCTGTAPVVLGMWRTPSGMGGPHIPIGPTDLVRIVTNDFMANGGDGYSVFLQGTHVVLTGDNLLAPLTEYIMANSPVAPVVQGRILLVP